MLIRMFPSIAHTVCIHCILTTLIARLKICLKLIIVYNQHEDSSNVFIIFCKYYETL